MDLASLWESREALRGNAFFRKDWGFLLWVGLVAGLSFLLFHKLKKRPEVEP